MIGQTDGAKGGSKKKRFLSKPKPVAAGNQTTFGKQRSEGFEKDLVCTIIRYIA